jgi:hypothetical protein
MRQIPLTFHSPEAPIIVLVRVYYGVLKTDRNMQGKFAGGD